MKSQLGVIEAGHPPTKGHGHVNIGAGHYFNYDVMPINETIKLVMMSLSR